MKITILLAMLLVVFASSVPALAARSDLRVFSDGRSEVRPAAVENEVIYRYQNDSQRFRVMRVSDARVASQALRQNPAIEYAEPNYVAKAYAAPNDPLYSYQWHFDNPDYGGIGTPTAWDSSTGAGTVVAVLDTGIAYEDFKEGRGRYKNEFVQAPDLEDTCFVAGYDFINDDTHANDDNAHGTHVAGTIAQSTNNGEGLAGLAYDSCLMPVKVLDGSGYGTYADIVNGIYFATDNGADVINLSLGGSAPSITLETALAYAYQNGVTVVAATGNDNGAVGYPAAYDDYVIAVGATRYDEARAPYSNYGPSIDVVAPGGDTSVDQDSDGYPDGVLQETFNPNTRNVSDFGYYFFQGTSMATPHVAGAAALLLANGNATNPDEVREALESTAEDLGPSGFDSLYGYGLIDLPAALSWTSGPTAPQAPVADAGGDQVVSDGDNDGFVEVSLSGIASYDADGFIVSYEWDLDGDGNTDRWGSIASTTLSVAVSPYVVALTVIDNDGLSDTDTVTITTTGNQAPTAESGADQTVTDTDGSGSELVTLSGNGSDSDGVVVAYRWYDETDTLIANISSLTTSAVLGTQTYTLEVVDNGGATDQDSVLVTVNEPVVIDLTLTGSKDRGRHLVDLAWSGATTATVDIWRDGREPTSTENTGSYTDRTNGRGGAIYTYQVCEADSTTACSTEVSISF